MANYPRNMHRGCCVAAEGFDRIYCFGRTSYKNLAFQYRVSDNVWEYMSWDYTLYRDFYDVGCAIYTKRGNGHRFLILTGAHTSRVQWFDLTAPSLWRSFTSDLTLNSGCLVSISPYEGYQVQKYANKSTTTT